MGGVAVKTLVFGSYPSFPSSVLLPLANRHHHVLFSPAAVAQGTLESCSRPLPPSLNICDHDLILRLTELAHRLFPIRQIMQSIGSNDWMKGFCAPVLQPHRNLLQTPARLSPASTIFGQSTCVVPQPSPVVAGITDHRSRSHL